MKAFLQVSGGILKYSLPLFPWFLVFQGLHLSLPVDFYVVALLFFFIWMASGSVVEICASHYRGWGHKKQLDEYIRSYIAPLYVIKDTDPLRSHLERLHEIGVNEITIKTKEDVSLFPRRLVRDAGLARSHGHNHYCLPVVNLIDIILRRSNCDFCTEGLRGHSAQHPREVLLLLGEVW